MSNLAVTPPAALTHQPTETSLGTVIQWAMQNGATVEQMRELYAFQREVKADQAREAYNRAFSAFKSEAIRIVKNVTVKAGPLQGTKYADLYGVVMAVTPALAKHGLTPSWSTPKDEKEWIEVQCTLRHDLGHFESVTMGGGPDVGAGRNALQARVSAKSYLKRVTLLDITGMAASDEDDDGNGGAANAIKAQRMSDEEFVQRRDAIQECVTVEELQRIYMAANEAAAKYNDDDSGRAFEQAKNAQFRKIKAGK